ncbi:hypothetical protein [Micromonospora aurantiaca (nom. illeg.)]|uniref:hypothetical protein n=1 Tax=Micromonospora aurantiaca (nom. illeg.) TaxID=47850 RepID=UPI003F4A1864
MSTVQQPRPIEAKVKAATVGGAGSAAVITPAVLWVIDEVWFNGAAAPDVPLPLVGLVGLVVTGVCAFAAGFWAKHTARPDLGRS